MSDTVLLARLRRSPWRRLVIALFAVPAILVGLLAMHALTTDGMTDAGVSVASATHHATSQALVPLDATAAMMASNPGTPTPAEDCGGMCGPGHEMLGMICVLALLVTVVLFTLQLILNGWQPLKRIAVAIAATAAALAPPPPPSLHVLSISRT